MATDITDTDHMIYNLLFTHVYSLNRQLNHGMIRWRFRNSLGTAYKHANIYHILI